MKRTNFAFRYEWNLAIAHLSPEYRLEILEATIRYAETGRLSDIAAEAFRTFILPDFERRRKAATYRARSKARKAQKEKTENQPVDPSLLTATEDPQDIEKARPQKFLPVRTVENAVCFRPRKSACKRNASATQPREPKARLQKRNQPQHPSHPYRTCTPHSGCDGMYNKNEVFSSQPD